MNQSIKHISLALLLAITTAYGMKKDTISTNSEPFTMYDMVIPNDVLESIFKHVYPSDVKIDDIDTFEVIIKDIDTVNAVAKMTREIRSVCKHWYHTCDPVTVRKLLNWNPLGIAYHFNTTSASWGEKYSRYMTFLANTLKDNPDLICLHTVITLNRILDAKIALAHGANPNQIRESYTPLSYALEKNNKEMFKLFLDHGAEVNHSLIFTALKKSDLLISIAAGFFVHSIMVIVCILMHDPSQIQSHLPIKYICSLIAGITATHLICVCPHPSTAQWPLTTIVKHYWKKLITFNKS